jgi:hypothetical protein
MLLHPSSQIPSSADKKVGSNEISKIYDTNNKVLHLTTVFAADRTTI